jgi:hypothetical protein
MLLLFLDKKKFENIALPRDDSTRDIAGYLGGVAEKATTTINQK